MPDTKPRAYTTDEVCQLFLRKCAAITRYWQKVPGQTPDERVEGAVFSILTGLDSAFHVSPAPHPDDKQYHIARGENYYPDEGDIAGSLHEHFHEALRSFDQCPTHKS